MDALQQQSVQLPEESMASASPAPPALDAYSSSSAYPVQVARQPPLVDSSRAAALPSSSTDESKTCVSDRMWRVEFYMISRGEFKQDTTCWINDLSKVEGCLENWHAARNTAGLYNHVEMRIRSFTRVQGEPAEWEQEDFM